MYMNSDTVSGQLMLDTFHHQNNQRRLNHMYDAIKKAKETAEKLEQEEEEATEKVRFMTSCLCPWHCLSIIDQK